MKLYRLSLLFLLLVLSSHSCKETSPKEESAPTEQEMRDRLIEFNKNKVKAEDSIIDDYVKEHYPDAETSPTGVRYKIYPIGDSIKAKYEEVALVSYKINLLGGELIYSTEEKGPEKIRIGHEDVPSGLHEALQYMSRGDSSVIVMPSYRAYGYTGEKGSVPQNAILIYHVELIDLQ